MSDPSAKSAAASSHATSAAVEIAVRLGMLFLLIALCLRIVAPFAGIVVWALILAIATNDSFERLSHWLGGRRTLAAAALVLLALGVLLVPSAALVETLVSGAQGFAAQLQAGESLVPPPPDKVAEWPVVGAPVYELWLLASQSLADALARFEPQLSELSQWLLGAAASAGGGLLQLIASLILAGFFLVRSDGRDALITRVAIRVAGERGPEFAALANATVKSVVQGIVGVAVIQALLAGLGFIAAGVPAAGLWALLVLISAVVQLPVVIALIPPIFLVYSASSATVTVIFAAWCVLVGLLDNVLKPLLFGRGSKVPTLVIFLGALGGMLSMGIVGLFLGAVILVLGYEIGVAWLEDADVGEGESHPQRRPDPDLPSGAA